MSTNVSAIGLSGNFQQFVIEVIIDPPNLPTDSSNTQNYALDSIAIGDALQVVAPYDAEAVIITAAPSGEGRIDVNFHNTNAGTVNLAPGLFKLIVTRG